MRILHLSDLHIGGHNDELIPGLLRAVERIQPCITIITGDLIDGYREESIEACVAFISQIAERSRIQPLVVPGNRDKNRKRKAPPSFEKLFTAAPVQLSQPANVWICPLDSVGESREGEFGSVAKSNFLAAVRDASRDPAQNFGDAFKVLALHHHLLPVIKQQDDRWLVARNSSDLLGHVLEKRIDLILHGHRHRPSLISLHAGFGIAHVTHSLCSGSALKLHETNWLNVVELLGDNEAIVESYAADREGREFPRVPVQRRLLRPFPSELNRRCARIVDQRGYLIRRMVYVTSINDDGDCRRVVECDQIQINDPYKASKHLLQVTLPRTTGFMPERTLQIRATKGNRLTEIDIEPTSGVSPGGARINFGRSLEHNELLSFEYAWWALNAMAMDQRQYRYKYGIAKKTECTSAPITHPVHELAIMVEFPKTFAEQPGFDLAHSLAIRIWNAERPSGEDREVGLEKALRDADALEYVDSLRIATLRVTHPVVGLSYGIEWALPPGPRPSDEGPRAEIRGFIDLLLSSANNPDEPFRNQMCALLFMVGEQIRIEFLGEWSGSVELSLMVFDRSSDPPLLRIVGAVIGTLDSLKFTTYREDTLPYGGGVAGKAYKTNEYRLWINVPERTTPDFYQPMIGSVKHTVLLSVPVQNPDDENFAYAILNFGSDAEDCPLQDFGGQSITDKKKLRDFQTALNTSCFNVFSSFAKQKNVVT